MSPKRLADFLRTLRAHGVRSYRDGALAVEFDPPEAPVLRLEEATKAPELTEDELLFGHMRRPDGR